MVNTGNSFGHPGGSWNDLQSPNTEFPTFDPICGVAEIIPATTSGNPIGLAIWPAVELGWAAATNKYYQVQWASRPAPATWLDFGSPIPGNGTTNFLLDTTRYGPQRFYGVLELP